MPRLRLQGISHIGEALLSEQVEANIVEFFKWGLLNVGGFTNVERPASGAYGGNFSRLRPANRNGYTNGQVWEGIRQDWVWESGVDYGYQPISISGVYVNNTFYPSDTTGTYAHNISYTNGQVIFDGAISQTSTVEVNYSYRNFYVNDASQPWFKEVFFNTHRPDQAHFLQITSGVFQASPEHRIQLPAIIVECAPQRDAVGLQIGGGQKVTQDVIFYVLAETPAERNKMIDIITYQKDSVIDTFDKNEIIDNNKFPLDYYGFLNDGALTYPDLVKQPEENGQYYWHKFFFQNYKFIPIPQLPPLYRAIVKGSFEIDMHEL